MSDQRKDSRKKLMAFTPVYDSISRSLLGYVGNINLLGLMVISEHSADTGREVMLNIEFPKSSNKMGEYALVTPARIVWCKQEDSAKSWTLGFEFTNLTTQQKEIIQAILERYHFHHNEE